MVALLLVGGIQLFFFGILGEYTGRTFLRVNNKPQTAVREVLNRKAAPSVGTRRIVVGPGVNIGNKPDL